MSYEYDLMEVFGELNHRGYSYSYWNRRDITIQLVQHAASPPARVLDIAAAQGNFSIALANLGYAVTWNDLREDLQGYVQLKHDGNPIIYLPGNAFEVAQDQRFDVVLATEIIEHCAHPDEFLSRASELVVPGGHIVITTPLGSYFRNKLPKFTECDDPSMFESIQFKPNADGHIFLLHQDELCSLAAGTGLHVKKTFITNNPLTSGHLKTERLLKIIPKGFIDIIEKVSRRTPTHLAYRIHSNIGVLLEKPT